jgi:beta-galactosidase/beta-glucuronidase
MTEQSASQQRISLDGEWRLAFDPEAEGLARDWQGDGAQVVRYDTVLAKCETP